MHDSPSWSMDWRIYWLLIIRSLPFRGWDYGSLDQGSNEPVRFWLPPVKGICLEGCFWHMNHLYCTSEGFLVLSLMFRVPVCINYTLAVTLFQPINPTVHCFLFCKWNLTVLRCILTSVNGTVYIKTWPFGSLQRKYTNVQTNAMLHICLVFYLLYK